MRRRQSTIRALLVAMLIAAAFFGGVQFERERFEREQWKRFIELDLPTHGAWLPYPDEKRWRELLSRPGLPRTGKAQPH